MDFEICLLVFFSLISLAALLRRELSVEGHTSPGECRRVVTGSGLGASLRFGCLLLELSFGVFRVRTSAGGSGMLSTAGDSPDASSCYELVAGRGLGFRV